jgi:hypothetical protein
MVFFSSALDDLSQMMGSSVFAGGIRGGSVQQLDTEVLCPAVPCLFSIGYCLCLFKLARWSAGTCLLVFW